MVLTVLQRLALLHPCAILFVMLLQMEVSIFFSREMVSSHMLYIVQHVQITSKIQVSGNAYFLKKGANRQISALFLGFEVF